MHCNRALNWVFSDWLDFLPLDVKCNVCEWISCAIFNLKTQVLNAYTPGYQMFKKMESSEVYIMYYFCAKLSCTAFCEKKSPLTHELQEILSNTKTSHDFSPFFVP